MTFTCGTCWREFPAGWHSREQHMKATGHEQPDFECNDCDRYFATQKAVNQHMDALGHWADSEESDKTDYECDDCSDVFSEEEKLREHEVEDHFYCDTHDRYYQDRNSIHNVRIHHTSLQSGWAKYFTAPSWRQPSPSNNGVPFLCKDAHKRNRVDPSFGARLLPKCTC